MWTGAPQNYRKLDWCSAQQLVGGSVKSGFRAGLSVQTVPERLKKIPRFLTMANTAAANRSKTRAH